MRRGGLGGENVSAQVRRLSTRASREFSPEIQAWMNDFSFWPTNWESLQPPRFGFLAFCAPFLDFYFDQLDPASNDGCPSQLAHAEHNHPSATREHRGDRHPAHGWISNLRNSRNHVRSVPRPFRSSFALHDHPLKRRIRNPSVRSQEQRLDRRHPRNPRTMDLAASEEGMTRPPDGPVNGRQPVH